MISMMHRLVESCGKYKSRIRASYVTGFFKGMFMKAPLMLCFFMVSGFMAGNMTTKTCLLYGLALLVFVALQAVLQNASDRLQSAAGFMVFADKRMELGDHFRKLSMGYFTDGNIGKVSSVLSTDMNFIEENCMGVLEMLVSFMISQLMMVAFMFYLDWRLGLAACVVVLVFLILGRLMMGNTLRHSVQKQECAQSLTSAVLEFAEGIGIIKTYNMMGEKSKELTGQFEKSCEDSISFEKDYSPWSAALLLTYGIGSTIILFLAAWLMKKGVISNVYMVGMILFLFDTFIGIKSYYSQIARLTVTNACLDRIESVFDEAEMESQGTDQLPPESQVARAADGKALPEISYENVTFSYGGASSKSPLGNDERSDERNALKDISFDVEKGQMLALVGPSGGGKSTIANLLARFWDVKEGSIKIRGKDIREVPVANLMDNISMVFQRVYLFQDTIFNNIAMGKTDATREEVIDVAKKARCYDFIMQLPQGFDTVIGEGGASLSGGEQQRISIARCMLKDAPIVILDEATASVDADNEHFIQEAISELCRGKTLIVIAHRLNTIRNADKILVIKNGQIVESGNHKELMAKGGQYATMVNKQNS
ncbi:MAG: ABC transporter ATP-binding protein/permease [Treponemataceae bacterium]|nr:ABC transporter ATP-binding protein/permease [Treponemataceae bacterium]